MPPLYLNVAVHFDGAKGWALHLAAASRLPPTTFAFQVDTH
jgi:hypothetical protein